jgi:hypothetical protein
VVLSSDDPKYGGFGNVRMQTYASRLENGRHFVELYIPARTCFVLKEKVILPEETEIETKVETETETESAEEK